MQLNERGNGSQESSNVAKEYISGLMDVIRHWDTLDDKTKQEAKAYYGYTLAVIVGVPTAATVAFLSRI